MGIVEATVAVGLTAVADASVAAARIGGAVVATVAVATAEDGVAASNRECRFTSAWPLLLP